MRKINEVFDYSLYEGLCSLGVVQPPSESAERIVQNLLSTIGDSPEGIRGAAMVMAGLGNLIKISDGIGVPVIPNTAIAELLQTFFANPIVVAAKDAELQAEVQP
jgi:hypothetical protein